MAEDFRKAMAKLAVLGQNTSQLVDCSEVIPDPIPLPEENSQSVFPAGFSNADVEQAVRYILLSVVILLLSTSFVSVPVHPSHDLLQILM